MPQLAQRLGFDLADTFACNVELLTDFLERLGGVRFYAEAQAQHLRFARRQRGIQNVLARIAQGSVDSRIDWSDRARILNEVAEMHVVFVANAGFHRDRHFGDLKEPAKR